MTHSPSSPPPLSVFASMQQHKQREIDLIFSVRGDGLNFGDNKVRVRETTGWKQDLTLTNIQSRSVFMEVQWACGRCVNADDAPSACAPAASEENGAKLFYFTFGMTTAAPESGPNARTLCSSVIIKSYNGRACEVKTMTED